MDKPYLNNIRKFIFLIDIAFLNSSIAIAHFMIFGNSYPNMSSWAFIIIANICWCGISLFNKNYKIQLPLNINTLFEKFFMTMIYLSLLVLAAIYFFKILNISRGLVTISFCFFSLLTILQRIWLFYFIEGKAGEYFEKRVIILGNKNIADSLIS
ncbi:MAG TPA: hypothetical protein VKR58_03225, partial [Aquella sp.]|nr:hypothetical protein [Aquella sp.]